MLWLLILFVISFVLQMIFYLVPYLFLNTRKWLIAYGLFWLSILTFLFFGALGAFHWLFEAEAYSISQSFFYSLTVAIFCFVPAILGIGGKIFLLQIENRGETINRSFLHASMFISCQIITPVLWTAIYLFFIFL